MARTRRLAAGPGQVWIPTSVTNGGVKLVRAEWLDAGPLTDAEKALIAQRFQDLEVNPHASVLWEQVKLRLMAPSKRAL